MLRPMQLEEHKKDKHETHEIHETHEQNLIINITATVMLKTQFFVIPDLIRDPKYFAITEGIAVKPAMTG